MIESSRFDPSREEVKDAVQRYLKEGGKIDDAHHKARMEVKAEILHQLVEKKKAEENNIKMVLIK